MTGGALVLWAIAFVLALWALRRATASARTALAEAGGRFVEFMPRIALAVMAAGFIGVLTPPEPVARFIGPDSGLTGLLVASVAGGFVPGGPILSFPLVVVLYKAGAGIPQLIAFLTAWSVIALHRILVYEVAFLGWRLAAVRLISSLVLPPLAGVTAMALSSAWSIL